MNHEIKYSCAYAPGVRETAEGRVLTALEKLQGEKGCTFPNLKTSLSRLSVFALRDLATLVGKVS